MMLKKLIHPLIAVLFILCADVCLLAAPPEATIQKAKTMIEQARQHLTSAYKRIWYFAD